MASQKKKVIVTGGLGFIGSHIVDLLVDAGFNVHIIDIKNSLKNKFRNKKATYHKRDIRKFNEIKNIFKDVYYVFHLAALPRVQFSIQNPLLTTETNINGTTSVLKAAVDAKVKRVVYSASSSAYGDQKKLPLTENMQANPKSPYGLQKYVGEMICKVFSEVYGIETVSLRYFNVYGPRLDPEGDYALVIGKFLKQRKNKKPITITGNGKQTRDFTHVYDVARANILAMKSHKVGSGEVINIGAGNGYSINSLAKIMGGPVKHIKPRHEPKHSTADNNLAQKLLGWSPKVSFKKGIKELKKEFGV